MKKTLLLLVLSLGANIALNAQKITLTQGNLSALKGETFFNVQFKYDDMVVGKKNEAEYISEKTTEFNNKETGRGDTWAAAWVTDREKLFEPKFEELFNKSAKTIGFSHTPQKYTIIFHTTFTEPGWNIGISRRSAAISGDAIIVETANPSKVIAKITVNNAPGRDVMGYDFATGPRIAEAYAITGKKLAPFIEKSMKK